MKRKAKKAFSYSESYKMHIIYAVMREGFRIASICTQFGIDNPFMVREWVREEKKKRGLVRIPRTLTKRGNAPKVLPSRNSAGHFNGISHVYDWLPEAGNLRC